MSKGLVKIYIILFCFVLIALFNFVLLNREEATVGLTQKTETTYPQKEELSTQISSTQISSKGDKDEGSRYEGLQNIDISRFQAKEPRTLEYPKFKIERPAEAINYYNLGVKSARRGDIISAIAFFEKAIELDPTYPPPYTEVGICYAKRGLFSKAIEAFKKAIAMEPNNLIASFNLGSIYEGMGNWSQAITEYMKVISQDPNNVMVRTRLGICLAEAGQNAAAIDQWNIAITIDPNYKEARVLLGKIYSETGDVPYVRTRYKLTYDSTRHSLDYVRETETISGEADALFAGYLFYDAAVEQYMEALRIDPYMAEAHAGLGFTFARAALRGSRLFHPERKEMRDEYSGAVRLKMTIPEMLEKAVYHLKTAISFEPKNAYYYCNLGVVYAEMGMYESAIQSLKKAIEIDPKLTAAHANLAVVYSYKGEVEKSREDYKKIAKIEPQKVRTMESLRLLQPEIRRKEEIVPVKEVPAAPTVVPPQPAPVQMQPPTQMPLLK